MYVGVEDGYRRGELEWNPACQHVVEHDAQGVDVRPCVYTLSLTLFRRHVEGCAHDHPGGGHGCERFGPCYPEVGDLGNVVLSDQDVLGFDISVHDTGFMCDREPVCDCCCNFGRSLYG